MSVPTIIDTEMHGRDGITAVFIVEGEKRALVEAGPKSSVHHVLRGLEQNAVEDLDWIVLTHIHLDHAGAAGTLAQRFPNARVAVHEVGAPHLIDPSKLWASAARIYGDEMERLWGGIDPIAEHRIEVVPDGGKIDLGGRTLQAVETPGHANHHHAFLDDETGLVFAGDALGVRLADVGVVRPATPPPEFDMDKAIASIERIRRLKPTSVWLTHFGPADPATVDATCDSAIQALHQWAAWVQDAGRASDDLDDVTATVKARAREVLERSLEEAQVDRMEQTTSYRMNTWGYIRYLDRQRKAG